MKPEIDAETAIFVAPRDLRERSARPASPVESAGSWRRNKASSSWSQSHVAIGIAQRYRASPTQAFRAWLDPEVAGRWLFATASQPMSDVEIDGRVGGSFCLVERQAGGTKYTGQYLAIVPNQRLVFTLSMEPHPNVITRVTVAIAPLAKGCSLNLMHENVPPDNANYLEGRWTGILYGLGVTLDAVSGSSHRDQEEE